MWSSDGIIIQSTFNSTNMSRYKKLTSWAGDIDSAMAKLKGSDELVCCQFNGIWLYSDVDTIDTAYKKITGKTKAEFEAMIKERQDEYQEQKRRHEEAIPELTKEWIEKGNAVLDEKYREKWAQCVPIRLADLYQGMELKCCLDIVIELNNGCPFEVARKILDDQGHSGTSFGLVCSMVRSFCDRGDGFASYVR